MKFLAPLLFTTLLSASCTRGHDSQLTELRAELRTERELLAATRAELQALITELKPFLAKMAQRSQRPTVDPNAESTAVTDDEFTGIARVNELEVRVTHGLVNRLLNNTSRLARGARIVPSIKDGKANGFKVYAIRPTSVYAKLGFKNGDAIHRINGMGLDTPDEALEAYTKLREASELLIDITRRGNAIRLRIEIVEAL